MAWTVSAELEDALWVAASACLPADALGGRVLTRAIIDRSRRYTSERARLHQPVAGPVESADVAARALFFTIADAAKVMIPLAELDRAGLLARGRPLKLLDLGAGVGAMSLGALDYLHRAGALAPGGAVVIRAVDRDARALDVMRAAVAVLAERWRVSIDVIIERADLARGPATAPGAAPADLVLAGSLLNELDSTRAREVVRHMVDAVDHRADCGAVIIIEPALRDIARQLHELRDWMIEHRIAHVLAPCTRRVAPCPALADESDWCHEDRPTALPARTARLAAATGLRAHGLKFAYLVLRRAPPPGPLGLGLGIAPELAGQGVQALRMVSQPRKSKGKRECYVCSDAGRSSLRLLRRNATEDNLALERAQRGDVLVAPAELAGGGDVGAHDRVVVVSAAEPDDSGAQE
jgi:ribosomal protein RSM22 (predicted rRNA methylase)